MPKWVRKGNPIVGARVDNWVGDTGGAGESMPADCVAFVAFDTVARQMHLFAYSPEGGDLRYMVPFSEIAIEPGTTFPTGRFDPTNLPTLTFHDGMLKAWVKAWNGGGSGPSPLLRLYLNVFWE